MVAIKIYVFVELERPFDQFFATQNGKSHLNCLFYPHSDKNTVRVSQSEFLLHLICIIWTSYQMMGPKKKKRNQTKHCHLFIQGSHWPPYKISEYCQTLKVLPLSASVLPKADILK